MSATIERLFGKPWSTADERRLLAMADEGWSLAQCGAALGRTAKACERRLDRLRNAKPRGEWRDIFGDHPAPVEVHS